MQHLIQEFLKQDLPTICATGFITWIQYFGYLLMVERSAEWKMTVVKYTVTFVSRQRRFEDPCTASRGNCPVRHTGQSKVRLAIRAEEVIQWKSTLRPPLNEVTSQLQPLIGWVYMITDWCYRASQDALELAPLWLRPCAVFNSTAPLYLHACYTDTMYMYTCLCWCSLVWLFIAKMKILVLRRSILWKKKKRFRNTCVLSIHVVADVAVTRKPT